MARSGKNVKVLVLGPGEAGKSTLIAALCTNAMNLEVRGRTVALDYGTVDHDGVVFHFFGVPGQAHFKPVQESLLAGSQVAVVVRRKGETLDPLTVQWCSELAGRAVPLVLVTNVVPHRSEQKDLQERTKNHTWGNGVPFAASYELDLANPSEAGRLLPMLHRLVEKEERP